MFKNGCLISINIYIIDKPETNDNTINTFFLLSITVYLNPTPQMLKINK